MLGVDSHTAVVRDVNGSFRQDYFFEASQAKWILFIRLKRDDRVV